MISRPAYERERRTARVKRIVEAGQIKNDELQSLLANLVDKGLTVLPGRGGDRLHRSAVRGVPPPERAPLMGVDAIPRINLHQRQFAPPLAPRRTALSLPTDRQRPRGEQTRRAGCSARGNSDL